MEITSEEITDILDGMKEHNKIINAITALILDAYKADVEGVTCELAAPPDEPEKQEYYGVEKDGEIKYLLHITNAENTLYWPEYWLEMMDNLDAKREDWDEDERDLYDKITDASK